MKIKTRRCAFLRTRLYKAVVKVDELTTELDKTRKELNRQQAKSHERWEDYNISLYENDKLKAGIEALTTERDEWKRIAKDYRTKYINIKVERDKAESESNNVILFMQKGIDGANENANNMFKLYGAYKKAFTKLAKETDSECEYCVHQAENAYPCYTCIDFNEINNFKFDFERFSQVDKDINGSTTEQVTGKLEEPVFVTGLSTPDDVDKPLGKLDFYCQRCAELEERLMNYNVAIPKERLTVKHLGIWELIKTEHQPCREVCDEQGLNGCATCPICEAIDKLAEYEDAEEQTLRKYGYPPNTSISDLVKSYIKELDSIFEKYSVEEQRDKWRLEAVDKKWKLLEAVCENRIRQWATAECKDGDNNE